VVSSSTCSSVLSRSEEVDTVQIADVHSPVVRQWALVAVLIDIHAKQDDIHAVKLLEQHYALATHRKFTGVASVPIGLSKVVTHCVHSVYIRHLLCGRTLAAVRFESVQENRLMIRLQVGVVFGRCCSMRCSTAHCIVQEASFLQGDRNC
jgi:hypothetical protein